MSGTLLRIALVALVTTAAVATFVITSGGPALSMSTPSAAVQSAMHQASARIGAETQGQGYMTLAATRDHRSKSSTNVRDLGSAQGGVSVQEGKTRPKPGTTACVVNPVTGKYYCKTF